MNLLNFLFGRKEKDSNKELTKKTNLLNVFAPTFTNNIKKNFNARYVANVQAHAKNFSKIAPYVVYRDNEITQNRFKRLNKLLELEPNRIMSAPSFYERLAYDYFMTGNAFVWIEYDYSQNDIPVKNLWIIDPYESAMQTYVNPDTKEVYVQFMVDGMQYASNVKDMLILNREANPNSLFGKLDRSIDTTLRAIQTNYEGIEQAIKMSAYIRFIVKSVSPIKEDVKKARSEEFANTYLNGNNSTGLIYIDGAQEIQQVNSSAKFIEPEQMNFFYGEIDSYLGINQKIVQGSYTEDEWQSYYETSIEPLILKLQKEMERKLLTPKEYAQGNRILINSDRLQTASLKTRISLANAYMKLPVYIPNVVASLLFLPKSENGDKEFSNLNYVQTEKQNSYQLGEEDKKEVEPNEPKPNDQDGTTKADI